MTAPAPAVIGELAQRHLDAAYNLGHWLLGNPADAADAVHDAFVRALRSAHTFAGGDARTWWLAIVRNCCLAKLGGRGRDALHGAADITQMGDAPIAANDDVEARIDHDQRHTQLMRALRALPVEFRETLVLREIEDLSYREIADVLGVPIGTVMSRLARGRALLQRALAPTAPKESGHGV
ncbi:MAG: sigma-70 family RNA polymerase sigma factor [Proteobacteria bacterium]|nr:sigma-70 family RNA polymerase sigma factor [Pseudomonadota bacterium]MBS0461012.1 sigma-70 family RNA polymerase sigma factor [Pseudomonadota bacterium]MBS0464970.1 sigma-70 family RNA polymerase sigma factor [Pseudomonadota bacterium]